MPLQEQFWEEHTRTMLGLGTDAINIVSPQDSNMILFSPPFLANRKSSFNSYLDSLVSQKRYHSHVCILLEPGIYKPHTRLWQTSSLAPFLSILCLQEWWPKRSGTKRYPDLHTLSHLTQNQWTTTIQYAIPANTNRFWMQKKRKQSLLLYKT